MAQITPPPCLPCTSFGWPKSVRILSEFYLTSKFFYPSLARWNNLRLEHFKSFDKISNLFMAEASAIWDYDTCQILETQRQASWDNPGCRNFKPQKHFHFILMDFMFNLLLHHNNFQKKIMKHYTLDQTLKKFESWNCTYTFNVFWVWNENRFLQQLNCQRISCDSNKLRKSCVF